ncbi:MAG TPA: hypothetical protein VHS05_27420 [Pyrinomonadaceae bacterium]|nr:hypothetical protein [Pyrinomonadaceae bacterium]
MEFLLNQQVQFDADMCRLEAAQAASERRLDRISETLSSYATILFENFKITDSRIRELTESQKLTDAALRKLLTRFDRHLNEDHPGLEN